MTTNKIQSWMWRMVCMAMLVVLAMPADAQRRRGGFGDGDHFHFGYISGHVGYSLLDTRASGVIPVGNVGGGIGLGYEYRLSGLWANIGVQFSMNRSKLQFDPYTISHEGKIRDANLMREGTLLYDVKQVDEIQWNFIDVPILFGYYTHGFHVGAGLKVSYALNPKSYTTGTYNLRFHYENAQAGTMFTYENNPLLGLKEYEFKTEQANRLNVGVSLIGEIGYDLLSSLPTNSRICHVLKMSFYFEYGLNNYNKGDDKARFELPAPDENGEAKATGVVFNSYLNTAAGSLRTVPFIAGLKLTYMIGGSRTARAGFHHGCMCYN